MYVYACAHARMRMRQRDSEHERERARERASEREEALTRRPSRRWGQVGCPQALLRQLPHALLEQWRRDSKLCLQPCTPTPTTASSFRCVGACVHTRIDTHAQARPVCLAASKRYDCNVSASSRIDTHAQALPGIGEKKVLGLGR